MSESLSRRTKSLSSRRLVEPKSRKGNFGRGENLNHELSQRKLPSLGRRHLSVDSLPNVSRSNYSRERSLTRTPPHSNNLGIRLYPPSVASDSDGISVSSIWSNSAIENRQPERSVRSERSVREESPIRVDSNDIGKVSNENLSAAKKLVEDLKRNINDKKRVIILSNMCHEFDHWNETRHGAELLFGAANVLAMALSKSNNDHEISMICAALEMVFRASPQNVCDALDSIQISFIPWLLEIIENADEGAIQHSDSIVLAISKILYYLSRILTLRTSLVRCHGMVETLSRVVKVCDYEAKAFRMKTISNLANKDENKAYLFNYNGFLETIMRVAVVKTTEKCKEYASITLMDLASCPENQVSMANNDKLLATLVKLAVTESIQETREAAISSLQNLAFCHTARFRLVTYSDGVILDALRKALSTDLNDKARRRAAGALTNLACDETAEYIGSHKGLLESLASATSKDENSDVQSRSAMALTKLASSITCKMPCYDALMDALIMASLSHTSPSISHIFRVHARDPENRVSMASHPGVLDTLAGITLSRVHGIHDRENAMRAIMHLTNEDSNRELMCQKLVLEALKVGANTEGLQRKEFYESAVLSLERLATEPKNRATIARFPGMLVTIARVTEREQSLIDNGVHGSHERLAKPLLLSLLLAL